MQLSIELPLSVPISRNKRFILNINNYRNAHYQTLNKAKSNYNALVFHALQNSKQLNVRFNSPVVVEYLYYHPTKRNVDLCNPCSIIDKFACDAITHAGIWADDNCDIIKGVSFKWGGVDRVNPRCIMTIKPIK